MNTTTIHQPSRAAYYTHSHNQCPMVGGCFGIFSHKRIYENVKLHAVNLYWNSTDEGPTC